MARTRTSGRLYMPFVIGFLRFLLLLFLLRLVVRAVARLFAPAATPARRSASGGPARQAGAVPLVRDRVCNTFVPRTRALIAHIDGHEEHFCSAACRERALREPAVLGSVPRAS